MSTGNLIKRIRTHTIDFRFTANGEISWSFTAEGDSSIYAVESNNVASYTINGVAVTLPYAVTNRSSYTVAITKTNAGQVADIQLKIWSGEDKTTTINVPDVGANDGRYIYCLAQAKDKVYVLDSNLLKGSNYLGGGSFTVTPIVAAIALPILPNSTAWAKIIFVIDNENPRILIISDGDSTDKKFYMSYIKPDFTVWNLDETLQDAYSEYYDSGMGVNFEIFQPWYDYINNRVVFASYYLWYFDIDGKILSDGQFGTSANTRFFQVSSDLKIPFNPVLQEFAKGHDYRYNEETFYNWRNYFQIADIVSYSRNENAYYKTVNNSVLSIRKVTREDALLLGGGINNYTGTTQVMMISSDAIGKGSRASKNTYGMTVFALSDLAGGGINLINTFTTTNTFNNWKDIEVSDFAQVFFLLESTSDDLDRRIFTYDNTGEISYFDMPENIHSLTTNRLLI